jgi:hypothetical protein
MDVRFEGVGFNVELVAGLKVNDFVEQYKDEFFTGADQATRKKLLKQAHALCVAQFNKSGNGNRTDNETGGD